MPLRAIVYMPEQHRAAKVPAVVLAQPVNTPSAYGRALTLELVAEGYVVLTFDWRGWNPAENRQLLRGRVPEILLLDMAAAIAHLRSLPEVDAERIAVAGHSVGGTMAIDAAVADPRVVAAAAIGMEADVTPTSPRNLLWAVGLYDEFRTLPRMRDCFWASATTTADINTTVGDFDRGTARRLAVSPTADHFTELQDRFLHREIVNWFNRAGGKVPTTRLFLMQLRQWLVLLAWLSSLLLAVWGLGGLGSHGRGPIHARLVAALALAGVLLIPRFASWELLWTQSLIQLMVLAALIVGFIHRRRAEIPDAPPRPSATRKVIRVVALIWLSIFLTLVANNIASYWYHPALALWIPVFAVQHLADMAYVYTLVYPQALFFAPGSSQVLVPRLWVYLILVAETLMPGIVLGTPVRLGRRKPQSVAAMRRRVPVAAVMILTALMVVLVALIAVRLQQGFLTTDSALAAGRFFLRFAVLPITLFFGFDRLNRRPAVSN
jgi:pimeloyl-ACP methyl ester carboxylesterase